MTPLPILFAAAFMALLLLSGTASASNQLPSEFINATKRHGLRPTTTSIMVDVSSQTLSLYHNGVKQTSYPISTAAQGVGYEVNSGKTPLGLHRIAKKYGQRAPLNSIFVSRKWTGQTWKPGSQQANLQLQEFGEDLILTRILWLEGLERGVNQGVNTYGRNVDSRERYIYIHGTNHENLIGSPKSHGCIRMRSNDVIELFDKVPEGTLVWIHSYTQTS